MPISNNSLINLTHPVGVHAFANAIFNYCTVYLAENMKYISKITADRRFVDSFSEDGLIEIKINSLNVISPSNAFILK